VRLLHAGHPDVDDPLLRDQPTPDEHTVREALSGNLCRCTGYQNIVEAVQLAARRGAAK
jgi:carbon-monoxide dehydrogenase small subunit